MVERKVEIMKGVNVKIDRRTIVIKGPKGELKKSFDDPRFNKSIEFNSDDKEVSIKTSSIKRGEKAVVGTIAAHIKNMMIGTTSGYRYIMKISYSHFPINITIKGSEIQIRNFMGEKGARIAKIIGKTTVKVDKTDVIVEGISVEDVGQTAANIEQACKLTRRDRRIFQDGIFISEKYHQTGEKMKF